MNIQEVSKQADGQPIRRNIWPSKRYININYKLTLKQWEDETGSVYHLSYRDLEADDWEVYEDDCPFKNVEFPADAPQYEDHEEDPEWVALRYRFHCYKANKDGLMGSWDLQKNLHNLLHKWGYDKRPTQEELTVYRNQNLDLKRTIADLKLKIKLLEYQQDKLQAAEA